MPEFIAATHPNALTDYAEPLALAERMRSQPEELSLETRATLIKECFIALAEHVDEIKIGSPEHSRPRLPAPIVLVGLSFGLLLNWLDGPAWMHLVAVAIDLLASFGLACRLFATINYRHGRYSRNATKLLALALMPLKPTARELAAALNDPDVNSIPAWRLARPDFVQRCVRFEGQSRSKSRAQVLANALPAKGWPRMITYRRRF